MARSAARPLVRTTLAATGYAAFWGALLAVTAPPKPAPLCTVPSHEPGAVAVPVAAQRVYEEVERRMRRRSPAERTRIARAILDEARRAAMDPLLVVAVIQVESGFDPRAVSPVGAAGLMQLLDATMRDELTRARLGTVDPHDPVPNVRAGVRYLDRMLRTFHGLDVALMAYNAGPGRIRHHLRRGAIPQRFLAYPRTVLRTRARLAASGAVDRGSRRAAVAHASPPGGAPRRSGGELAAPPVQRDPPIVAPAVPVAAAVPNGSRRRALGAT